MNVVMISTDRNAFDAQSSVSKRFLEYGTLFKKLYVVVLNVGEEKPYDLSDNVHIIPLNASSKIHYLLKMPKTDFYEIDVVSSQDAFLTGFLGYRLAKKYRAKFHVQIHTDLFAQAYKNFSLKNMIEVFVSKRLLQKADAIRVVSLRIKNSLKKVLKKETPITLLPIYVEKREVTEEKTYPFSQVVTTIARLEDEKRVSLTLAAFHEIAQTRLDVGLVIIGSGRNRNMLEALIRAYDIEDQVIFEGTVANVSNILAVSDVYIQTSAYEGYGMALVEAAQLGLPIVTTDVGIVGEVLVDGGSAFVTTGEAKDCARKLATLLDDDVLANSFGARAKEVVEDHLIDKATHLEQYKKALEL